MQFYTVEELSNKRFLTPEGFLLIYGVPIARTGIQLYAAEEVPVDPDGAGAVKIERHEEDVFRPDTIASFEGKPVTIDHPPELLNPDNWKKYAVGNIQNIRRADGIDNDLLLADILVTDKDAIDAIEDGKVEVSCGYDAEYQQIAPGRGRQINIIGNHLALVDNGRCGPRCAIGDNQRSIDMKDTITDRIKERILGAFKTRDAKAFDEAVADFEAITTAGGNENINHINANVVGGGKPQEPTSGERLRVIEDWMKTRDAEREEEKKKAEDAKRAHDEEEKKKDEEKKKGEDSEYEKKEDEEEKEHEKRTGDALKLIRSQAEILSPGFTLPTLDCKCKDKSVRDQISAIKRQALDKAIATDTGKKVLTPLLAGKTLDKVSHAVLDTLFAAATEIMKSTNNSKASVTNDNNKTVDAFSKGGLDKINQDFWNKRKGS